MENWLPISPIVFGFTLLGAGIGLLCSYAHERLRYRRSLSKTSRRNWLCCIYLIPIVGPLLYLRNHKQWVAQREAAYTLD